MNVLIAVGMGLLAGLIGTVALTISETVEASLTCSVELPICPTSVVS